MEPVIYLFFLCESPLPARLTGKLWNALTRWGLSPRECSLGVRLIAYFLFFLSRFCFSISGTLSKMGRQWLGGCIDLPVTEWFGSVSECVETF